MLRMGKLTDYGIVMMSYIAAHYTQRHSAHMISKAVRVPLPTVRKILKVLSNHGLLLSERGAQGGYVLNGDPATISVAQIITAIEGPIALTECVSSASQCDQETHCAVQTNWAQINNAVFHALDEVKLADMLTPKLMATRPINFHPPAYRAKAVTLQEGDQNE